MAKAPNIPSSVVDAAVQKAGGHIKLAKALGVDYQLIRYWQRNGAPPWRADALYEYLAPKRRRRRPAEGAAGKAA